MVKGWLLGGLLAVGLGASGCLATYPSGYDGGYGYDHGYGPVYHAPVTVIRPHYIAPPPPPRPHPAPPHWAPPPPPPRPHPPDGPRWRPESRHDQPPQHRAEPPRRPEPERRADKDDRREHHPRPGERPNAPPR